MPINHSIATVLVILCALSSLANAYSTPSHRVPTAPTSTDEAPKIESPQPSAVARAAANISTPTRSTYTSPLSFVQKGISTLALTAAITLSSTTTVLPPTPAHAESLDYAAEDTIDIVLRNLKDATGDTAKSFKVFESINDIITEGTGVGGSLSYSTFYYDYSSISLRCFIFPLSRR